MTEVKLVGGTSVYTILSAEEVRGYLQAGVQTKSFKGFLDAEGTQEILVSVYSILYVIL